MSNVQEIINHLEVDGNLVKIPESYGILDRITYSAIDKALTGIGGKWNRKLRGHVFEVDPAERIAQIQAGERVNLKKDFQYFSTPAALAYTMAELTGVEQYYVPGTEPRILEPHAGSGSLIKAVAEIWPYAVVECCELMPENRIKLQSIKNAALVGEDFIEYAALTEGKEGAIYDIIIANPPFRNNQDIDHIYLMNGLLKKGGRLVTIASKHWQTSQNKKEKNFVSWLKKRNATVREIEAGTFKESGTEIPTVLIWFDKKF